MYKCKINHILKPFNHMYVSVLCVFELNFTKLIEEIQPSGQLKRKTHKSPNKQIS